jgi:hypothetical protein
MMTAIRRSLFLLAIWAGLAQTALAEKIAWNPSQSRAVIVGVLSWEDPTIGTFAKAERKDRELYETLLQRGVPAENVSLLLDEQATRQAVLDALSAQLNASRPGETFIFYYAGHGVVRRKQTMFVPYDFGKADGLSMTDLGELLAERLQAERALLFADCCFSGALGEIADDLEASGIQAASLTSATAHLPSIANWTFTQTLVDCLNGQSPGDRDGDQAITLQETASEIADAMRFHEIQQSGVTSRGWFEHLVMAPAPAIDRTLEAPFSLFDYVLVQHEGQKGMGRISGMENGNFVVELQAYSQRVPVEVPAQHLSPLPPAPAETLPEEEAQRKASVEGKYSNLLRTIEVEPDYLQYADFTDYGFQAACGYRGYPSLPEGYWVYVYPRWYIWSEQNRK